MSLIRSGNNKDAALRRITLACLVLFTSVFVGGALSSPTQAQEVLRDSIRIPKLGEWPSFEDDATTNLENSADKLTSARKLIRERKFEPAAALLEIILEEGPTNDVVANLLRSCYLELGQREKAEVLVRRQLAGNPDNISNRILLAELLADRGRSDEAMSNYRTAITALRPAGKRQLRLVVSSMLEHALYDSCRFVIGEFRRELRDSMLFRLEEGSCHERRRNYREAAATYLPLLAQDTVPEFTDPERNAHNMVAMGDAAEAERRLQQLLSYGESAAEVEVFLVGKLNTFEGSLPYVLMNHLVTVGRFDEALNLAIRQDSAKPQYGQVLQRHVRLCVERKAYAAALRGAEIFLQRHGGSHLIPDVQFSMAAAYRGLRKFSESEATYRSIIANGKPRDKSEGWYQLGLLQLDYLFEPARALVSFDSSLAVGKIGFHQGARRARPFALAESGKFEQARDEWSRLADTTRGMSAEDDLVEEARYHLALLELFDGKIDSSKVAFRKLMIDHPRGLYANDAVTHLVVFTDADSAHALLETYLRAERERFMHHDDSAAVLLQALSVHENQVLAPLALYRLAELAVSNDDTSRAVGYLGRLKTEFPGSHYLPYGLKLEADLATNQPDRLNERIRIYRHILKEYPYFPFNSSIRETLKQIESGSLVG